MKNFLVIVFAAFCCLLFKQIIQRSDSYIRNRVLKIYSDEGSCSAVQVITPKGQVYTLTAAHCRPLVKDGKIMASDEQGTKYTLSFVAEDPDSDLMLLTAANTKSVDVAEGVHAHQVVHTMTHGRGYPSYRTDGELVTKELMTVPLEAINGPEDLIKCEGPKYVVLMSPMGPWCAMSTRQLVSTARIIPGSSGGPLLNSANELVGIASATDGEISSFVALSDIKHFLSAF